MFRESVLLLFLGEHKRLKTMQHNEKKQKKLETQDKMEIAFVIGTLLSRKQ